jgi:hypothetical protein
MVRICWHPLTEATPLTLADGVSMGTQFTLSTRQL